MNSTDLRLVVGLGNPGSKYVDTRHNIGFMVLDKLAQQESVQFSQSKKLFGEITEIGIHNPKQRLLKPTTYMNESGRSIKATMEWFGLKANEILILLDDMDLPLGRLRIRTKGSSGGHNGLKSAINHLGTEEFCRLRIGIGPPDADPEDRKAKTTSHVLGKFNASEIKIVEETINEVILGFELINKVGIELASNQINSYKK